MRTLARKPKATQQTTSAKSTNPGRAHFGQRGEANSILQLQRMIGNQSLQRMLKANAGRPTAGLADTAPPDSLHDFRRIPARPRAPGMLQAKLAINKPGDLHEREADHVAGQVMRMEAPSIGSTAPPAIQRLCATCEDEALHRKPGPAVAGEHRGQSPHQAEAKVDAVSGGKPLTSEQRAFYEPRFGADFRQVRIHTGRSADSAARAVGAVAYTRGGDIVFRGDQYHPHTHAGRYLLAHELTHVIQQGAAPQVRSRSEGGAQPMQSTESQSHMRAPHSVVQRQPFPGDGMVPPGDCGWARYLLLRGSVETAKAVVSTLGACSAGDSCIFLATKIAAITAEIAARVALDTTCFRGGDAGHRQQVQDKINMMNRCYRFFNTSNCPPELIAAMAVVVERAREVIAVGAAVVAIALVVALIAAIIALAKVIAALVAAAAAATAEAAAIAAAAAAVIALLTLITDELAPDGA